MKQKSKERHVWFFPFDLNMNIVGKSQVFKDVVTVWLCESRGDRRKIAYIYHKKLNFISNWIKFVFS